MASNSINSTTQNLYAGGQNDEDWSNFFCARDEDEREYSLADESSDSDSDLEPMDIEETEYEDEMDEPPAIQVGRTHVLQNRLAKGDLAPKVKYVLQAMKTVGMDVPIFLDALSWGTEECTRDGEIRYQRSALLQSKELPGILLRWWKAPKRSRVKAATSTMEAFAATCSQAILHWELKGVADIMLSPVGKDIEEDTLTGVNFKKMIHQMAVCAPTLWTTLRNLAYTPEQQKRNTSKNPDKVN